MSKALTTFGDLHQDIEQAFKNDEFKTLLNKQPPEAWISKNAMANNSRYLPIDKTEFLLDKIFQMWKVEVLREGTMFNSVYVTVRVHYLHPIDQQWYYHDGVGAKDLQKDSGTTLSMETIKGAAVQMALPTAKSLAIKDACDHLGKLFGRDLNRKNTIDFIPGYLKPETTNNKEEERLLSLIESCKTQSALLKLKSACSTSAENIAYDKKFNEFSTK